MIIIVVIDIVVIIIVIGVIVIIIVVIDIVVIIIVIGVGVIIVVIGVIVIIIVIYVVMIIIVIGVVVIIIIGVVVIIIVIGVVVIIIIIIGVPVKVPLLVVLVPLQIVPQVHVLIGQQAHQIGHGQLGQIVQIQVGPVPGQFQHQRGLAGADAEPLCQSQGLVGRLNALAEHQAGAVEGVQAFVHLGGQLLLQPGGAVAVAAVHAE